ncbi:hypothetical protein DESC_780420 [Desulfosarcina cetonica]|nr:hypothetical protein DESC_780420 [Desulfosarcina cetonica]
MRRGSLRPGFPRPGWRWVGAAFFGRFGASIQPQHGAGDRHGVDFCHRFFPRFYRNYVHSRSRAGTDHDRIRLRPGLVLHSHRGQPADLVHDAAFRVFAFLPEGGDAAGNRYRAYLPGHYSLRAGAGHRSDHRGPVPPTGHLAAESGVWPLSVHVPFCFKLSIHFPTKGGISDEKKRIPENGRNRRGNGCSGHGGLGGLLQEGRRRENVAGPGRRNQKDLRVAHGDDLAAETAGASGRLRAPGQTHRRTVRRPHQDPGVRRR